MPIVSASRRTDIPAFYADWFISRIHEGYVLYPLPHSDKLKYLELTSENVECIVFWSKNYEKLITYFNILDQKGFDYYFHFTINNYSNQLEVNTISTEKAIEQVKRLADHKSPEHVLWRYDPIITTKDMNINYHLYNFETLAAKLQGLTSRCYIEFVDMYRKVERNFNNIDLSYTPLSQQQKYKLTSGLASIASNYGIEVYACCDNSLVSEVVQQAHCIDPELVVKLTGRTINYNFAPTRNDCGCVKSIDIGEYGSCLHGCLYCYACENIEASKQFYNNFEHTAAAMDKSKLKKFDNINLHKNTHKEDGQLKLF
jgi:hypothetical protein